MLERTWRLHPSSFHAVIVEAATYCMREVLKWCFHFCHVVLLKNSKRIKVSKWKKTLSQNRMGGVCSQSCCVLSTSKLEPHLGAVTQSADLPPADLCPHNQGLRKPHFPRWTAGKGSGQLIWCHIAPRRTRPVDRVLCSCRGVWLL